MSTVFEKKFAAAIDAQNATGEGNFAFESLVDEVAAEESAVFNGLDEAAAHAGEAGHGSEAVEELAAEEFSRHSRLSSFLPPAMIHGRPWKWISAAFAMGLLLGAGGVFAIMSARPPEKIVTERIIRDTKVVYRDAPLAADVVEAEAAQEIADGDVRQTGGSSKGRRGRRTPETQADRKQRLLAELNVGATASGASASSGAGLAQKEMSAVVNRNRSSLQLCYERELKKGTAPASGDLKVIFQVNVGTSGTVTSVSMKGNGTQIDGLKKCLDGAVRSWMFPSSSASSSVQFPIIFTPSR